MWLLVGLQPRRHETSATALRASILMKIKSLYCSHLHWQDFLQGVAQYLLNSDEIL
jgi:hypothetical protein